MSTTSRRVLLMLSLPVVVFLAGRSIMSKMSNGAYVDQRLRRLPDSGDRKPLNQRIGGYDAEAVGRHWGALDQTALRDEQRALEVDLVFPLVYGASLLSSLLVGWESLGRPFPFRWLLAPVALTIAGDWTENCSQLGQLQRFMAGRELQPGGIQLASAGTVVKLVSFSGTMLFVSALAACLVLSERRPRGTS